MSDFESRSVNIHEETERKSYNAMGAILKSGKFKEDMTDEEIHKLVDMAYENPSALFEDSQDE